MNKILILVVAIISTAFSSAFAQVSRLELDEIVIAFDLAYKAGLQKDAQEIVINEPLPIKGFDWYESPIQNASYVQSVRSGVKFHILTIMGGLLRMEGATQDSAVLTLCHELGHGIGGAPYKIENKFEDYESSLEAQSDYYSTIVCAPKIWEKLHPEKVVLSTLDQGRCSKFAGAGGTFAVNSCHRSFEAMKGFIEHQKFITHNLTPARFDQFDPIKVRTLNTDVDFYPSSQCRLDTLMNGALKRPRPACWFPEGLK